MAIVSFWSNGKEETAKTLSIVAIATNMAIEHNFKILLISTNYNDYTLESCFWEKEALDRASIIKTDKKQDLDSGIEGLSKIVKAKRLTPELITNYTKIVFKNRLEVLLGIKSESYEEYAKLRSVYLDIIKSAKNYYDIVFVDVNKGLDNEFIRDILAASDLIITNLTQRTKIIDTFMEIKEQEKLFQGKNNMLLIGRYDRFSKYNSKNIARYIGIKDKIATIPYCTLFFEACNEGKVADFFLRLKTIDETDRNAIFIKETNNATEMIIYKLQELRMRI